MSRLYDWITRGTRGAQSAAAAANKGMLYFVSDELKLERSSGSAWETMSPANGLVLLEEHVAAASATLDFTTRNKNGGSGASFQSDFDQYVIEMINMLPATDNVDLLLRVSTNGGVSYDSGANYDYANFINNTGLFSTPNVAAAAATSAKLIPTQDNTLANGGANLSLKVFNPLSATQHKHMIGSLCWWNNDNQFYNGTTGIRYISVTALNAFRLLYSSGNIASGTVRLYGISK